MIDICCHSKCSPRVTRVEKRSLPCAGESRNQTGRLVVLKTGSIVRQAARQIPDNMLGAAARNSVWLAKGLPREQLTIRDPFGRTPLFLAVWFKSHEMLDWLSSQLQEDTWHLDATFSIKVRNLLHLQNQYVEKIDYGLSTCSCQ